MRVIERKMNEAITASKEWRLDNTEVINEGNVSVVKLHGNKIAEVGPTFIKLYDGCNFDGVFQKKGEWFFHDSYRSIDLPFENGMEVS